MYTILDLNDDTFLKSIDPESMEAQWTEDKNKARVFYSRRLAETLIPKLKAKYHHFHPEFEVRVK